MAQFIITGGSLEDSKNALNLAESRGNASKISKSFIPNLSLWMLVFTFNVMLLLLFFKRTSTAPLAAIPHAAVILSRIVNLSTFQV